MRTGMQNGTGEKKHIGQKKTKNKTQNQNNTQITIVTNTSHENVVSPIFLGGLLRWWNCLWHKTFCPHNGHDAERLAPRDEADIVPGDSQ